jgi:hypothetical protein
MPSLWARQSNAGENQVGHSIISSVARLYGRPDGQMAFLNFPIGNEW